MIADDNFGPLCPREGLRCACAAATLSNEAEAVQYSVSRGHEHTISKQCSRFGSHDVFLSWLMIFSIIRNYVDKVLAITNNNF